MDFREVWMNTDVGEQPHFEIGRECAEKLQITNDVVISLMLICFILLFTNTATLLFYNRHVFLQMYRKRFQRLSSSETTSSVFPGMCDEVEMKAPI